MGHERFLNLLETLTGNFQNKYSRFRIIASLFSLVDKILIFPKEKKRKIIMQAAFLLFVMMVLCIFSDKKFSLKKKIHNGNIYICFVFIKMMGRVLKKLD